MMENIKLLVVPKSLLRCVDSSDSQKHSGDDLSPQIHVSILVGSL